MTLANQFNKFDITRMLSDLDIQYETEGRCMEALRSLSSITNAKPSDLSFCWYDGEEAAELISKSNAGVIFCKKSLQGLIHPREGCQLIFLDRPRQAFVIVANKMLEKQGRPEGISPRAVVSKTAVIGKGCYIGDYTVIGNNCRIGNHTVIYDKVTLAGDCTIGDRCIIHSGVTLGDDGFAFERDENGLHGFPHFGRVIIGDDVEICANSHIARGSLSDTVIGSGTKIDALVHISHNVVVGRNCEITAGAVIGGSTSIGDSTWIGLNSTLKDQIKVGNNVIVSSGASVIHDVPSNEIMAGVPAKSIKDKVKASPDRLFLMAGQQDRKN